MPDDTQTFTCECGRVSEIDWRAEIENRKLGAERVANAERLAKEER